MADVYLPFKDLNPNANPTHSVERRLFVDGETIGFNWANSCSPEDLLLGVSGGGSLASRTTPREAALIF